MVVKRFVEDKIRASSDALVVPPFECAWLCDEEHRIENERACIVFEVCGENDATIILKSNPGSRRIQHGSRNYTIIFGSNRNHCLKIERDGRICATAMDDWAKIDPNAFKKYWLYFDRGAIYVGVGEPSRDFLYAWTDADPIRDIQYAGLSAWDKHVSYRAFRVSRNCLYFQLSEFGGREGETGARALTEYCVSGLLGNLSVELGCNALALIDREVPFADPMAELVVPFLAERFGDVVKCSCFLGMPCKSIVALLKSHLLCANEMQVLDAALDWVFYGEPPSMEATMRPLHEIHQVLDQVRLSSIERKDLEGFLTHVLAERVPDFGKMVYKAMSAQDALLHGRNEEERSCSQISVVNRRQVQCAHLKMDHAQHCAIPHATELGFTYCGDDKGVCHYLGTNYGVQKWVNPMTLKKVNVKASSPAGRFTSPKGIVGDRFLSTSYAGPRMENGVSRCWWLVDLLEHMLICKHYTFRHDASQAYAQSWILQGSNNGENWTDLRRHNHDCTIHAKGAWGSWPVNAHQPFHMFRLLLLTTALSTEPPQFNLSNIEFYGTLISSKT